MSSTKRIHLNIYLNRIRDNISQVRKQLPPETKVCLVVKADAYGHGAEAVAATLKNEVDFFAVSTASEAMELRNVGVTTPILCLGYIWPEDWPEMIRQKVRFNVFREEDAKNLSDTAVLMGEKAIVHFSVDTGMNRLGFEPTAENAALIKKIAALPGIEAEGMFTHFAKADAEDLTDAYDAYGRFIAFIEALEREGLHIPICHAANSAASMVMRDTSLNMVRLGIVAYGVNPSEEMEHPYPLKPAMEIKSHVSFIQHLKAGESVSYGYTYQAPEPCTLAVIPIGYADGYSRLLSNKADVLIHGRRCPIRGRVCMDMMMVDVSGVDGVKVGDEVTALGRDGREEITAGELQALSGVLHYEYLCAFSHRRVPRIYLEEENK